MKKHAAESFVAAETPARRELGLVQVFTGDGKGKTSAALGIVLRAAGHSLRIYFAFFIKGERRAGEHKSLGLLPNVTVVSFGHNRFIDPQNPDSQEREAAHQGLAAVREAMLNGNYDIIVMDEINVAVSCNLVGVDELLRLLDDKPKNVELILTGRGAPTELVKRADLVTEMLKIKHPYDTGVKARKGVDY